MSKLTMQSPILISGAARSGTSMVAGVTEICGAWGGKMFGPQKANAKGMYEHVALRNLTKAYLREIEADPFCQFPLPEITGLMIPRDWRKNVERIMQNEGYQNGPWFYKCPKMAHIWPVWNFAFPEAKWVIVRRKTGDIVNSCCILGGRSKVRTLEGLKSIKDVRIGEYVLTHKDRFRKVTNTFKRPYFGEIVRLTLKTNRVGKHDAVCVSVTPEHRIFVERNGERQWVQAADLEHTDLVCIEGHKCSCGKTIPLNRAMCGECTARKRLQKWNAANWDERLRINRELGARPDHIFKRLSSEQRKKWHEGLLRYWRTGPDHPFKAIPYADKLKYIRKALLARRKGIVLECTMEKFLKNNNIKYVPQWYFKNKGINGFVDFYLPNINTVIECDDVRWHAFGKRRENDQCRDAALADMGVRVLRFTDDQIKNSFSEVASQIKELCCIATVGIAKIEKYITKERKSYHKYHQVFNLEVEEDESYVVNGIVVHNCKTGFMRAFDRTFAQRAVGVKNAHDGWLWWVHQHEKRFREMVDAGLNVKIVWPERMVDGDYSQMKETIEWLGLVWKDQEVKDFIEPKLWKSKFKKGLVDTPKPIKR